MPFPSRGAAAPAPTSAPVAPAVAPPAAPSAPAAPPAPVVAERQFYAHINGASVLKTESEARALPPTTLIIPADNQAGGWVAASAVFAAAPPAPAPAGISRASFAPPAAQPVAAAGASAPRGLFAGVSNAEVMRKGAYLNPGDYVAKICSAEWKQGRQKSMVIIEVEIIQSTYDPAKPDTEGCNREGSRASVFVAQNDSFASNMKEIVLAVSGFDSATGKARDVHDTVTPQECEALISPEQPFTGAMVYLEARNVTTRANSEFTRISWWPMPTKPSAANPQVQEPDFDRLFKEVR